MVVQFLETCLEVFHTSRNVCFHYFLVLCQSLAPSYTAFNQDEFGEAFIVQLICGDTVLTLRPAGRASSSSFSSSSSSSSSFSFSSSFSSSYIHGSNGRSTALAFTISDKHTRQRECPHINSKEAGSGPIRYTGFSSGEAAAFSIQKSQQLTKRTESSGALFNKLTV